MRIRSRIAETGNDVCNTDIEDDVSPVDMVVQEEIFCDLGAYGRVWGWQIVRPGLCILEVNFNLQKKVLDHFSIEGDHIQLSLFFEGDSIIEGQHTDRPFKLDAGLIRVNFQSHTDMQVMMPAQEQVRYITMIMSKAYFLDLLKNEAWKDNDVFYEDVNAGRHLFFDKGAFILNHQIQALLAQIFDREHIGALPAYRATYIDMKLREMFYLFHAQHNSRKPVLHNFDGETIAALQKAKALLSANPAKPLTIKELSRYVSLNEQKLKQGFRCLYDTTIYGYIFDLRMKEAARLVVDPNYSVSQVSADLGYKSTSHFISAFKKYYGQTPKQAAVQRLILDRKR
jgi:AraC-like DNA-binding protein